MAHGNTVAPRERINIVYKPSTQGMQEDIELPLKMLVMGDFTGQHDESPLEDRKIISVDKSNLEDVLAESNVDLNFHVKNTLSDDCDELNVAINIKSLRDFEPESIVNQLPELKKLLTLRMALSAIKSPMGNTPSFRKLLQSILDDKSARKRLRSEIQGKTPDIIDDE